MFDLSKIKRVIIKVGTNSLASKDCIGLDLDFINSLVRHIACLRAIGIEVVLVSSAAILAGVQRLGCDLPVDLFDKQMLAAVGQPLLMGAYCNAFAEYDIVASQVLLTSDSLENKSEKINFINTINRTLKNNIIPILNENDSIVVDEIKKGDNDGLSAKVAVTLNVDLLLILTDVDGLYDDNPQTNSYAKLISEVNEITPEIINMVNGFNGRRLGTGGMSSKLEAAQRCLEFGIPMAILNSHRLNENNGNYWQRFWSGNNPGTLFCKK